MNARLLGMAVCLLSILMAATGAWAADDDQKASFWMQKKLQYSTAILAGLTSEDFEQIAKNAHSMNALGHLEKWVRAGSSDYGSQLKIFEFANKQLIEMANDENLDGAAIAFVQLTLSCVNCHKVVRGPPRTTTTNSK